MSIHCYVGTPDHANPHVVHARFVRRDGQPTAVVPTLARIWAGRARRDAHALAAAVLAYDWEYLDDTITATACTLSGQHPVPGVGMPVGAPAACGAVVDASEPVSVFPLCRAGDLDTPWVYLIDPATSTVTVHTDDGEALARYRLDTCAIPHPLPPLPSGNALGRSGRARGVSTSPAGTAR
ncbi:hypothetical protein [Micromonospora sp. 4G55]|uniref:hypothetical protein n=1 Tax=Micromonospora sp. 4G55 TaxID=2806102 RepID=UPI001A64374E|nr:hypothetical protein [Micromonospora sp. 4G55]MBM0259526.1 hypothetical protein [Micromonospora sp. 4G55]